MLGLRKRPPKILMLLRFRPHGMTSKGVKKLQLLWLERAIEVVGHYLVETL